MKLYNVMQIMKFKEFVIYANQKMHMKSMRTIGT